MTLSHHLPKWGEGKGYTGSDNGTDRYMKLIGQTGRHLGIDNTHKIGLEYSQIISQSEF